MSEKPPETWEQAWDRGASGEELSAIAARDLADARARIETGRAEAEAAAHPRDRFRGKSADEINAAWDRGEVQKVLRGGKSK